MKAARIREYNKRLVLEDVHPLAVRRSAAASDSQGQQDQALLHHVRAREEASMKAARIWEYNARLVLEDVPIPDVQPDEVLVQV